MALGNGPDEILFPATGHNPRSPAIRGVVRHRPNATPALAVDGKPADPLAYEGANTSPDGAYAISIWRGVQLQGETTTLAVTLRGANGQPTELTPRDPLRRHADAGRTGARAIAA